jgi:hypothetical protein
MPRHTESLLAPLRLLAPALIPSWNFFDVIAPAPRVEYALLASPGDTTGTWRVFRPRPKRISLARMARRLFWNPRWNQSLFVMSCAERLAEDRTPEHSEAELFKRIAADLAADAADPARPWLCFRLVFVSRQGESLTEEVMVQPAPRRLAEIDIR